MRLVFGTFGLEVKEEENMILTRIAKAASHEYKHPYIHKCATRKRDDSDKTDDVANVDTVLIIPSFENGFGRSGFGLGRIDVDDDDDDDDEDDIPFNPFHFNFRPIHNPFSGIWENLQNTMKRLRDQMSRIPTPGISYPFGKIPEGANKTSTTKIIDGHIVTINETTYNDNDSNATFVFKIRTVDIQPQNGTGFIGIDDNGDVNVDNTDNGGGEQIEKDKDSKSLDSNNNNNETTTERSVETVEDPGNNEIPDNQVETLTA
ncbi:hypothetical protein PV327_003570 [Microctonus hyperodae]|uniref:Uncharacterized protein n=1 Tax=Microctonus hyperodae TaxID=165561 RepID=A0AA39G491_MICHY|nr:hypothetical protein PV327_003570 [Microctonus hyperodae]